jgi:hypothetical protein
LVLWLISDFWFLMMTLTLGAPHSTNEIFYPSEDGEPLAESHDHVLAIAYTLDVLTRFLARQRATVLADQFLYYAQGFPCRNTYPERKPGFRGEKSVPRMTEER